MPRLPLESINDLNILESFFEMENNYGDLIMVPFMAKTGGSGAQESTQRILNNIFGNDVATQLNWKGVIKNNVTPKLGFTNFQERVKLITGSVQLIAPRATEKSIEEYQILAEALYTPRCLMSSNHLYFRPALLICCIFGNGDILYMFL